jgi:hypothetical protein
LAALLVKTNSLVNWESGLSPYKKPLKTYGLELYPPELNLLYNINGSVLNFSKKEDRIEKEVLDQNSIRYFFRISDWFWGYMYRLLPSLTAQVKSQLTYRIKKFFR